MLYRVYKTSLSFTHHLSGGSELVDKSCLMEHQHDNSDFLNLTIKLIDSGKWIDFKTIKQKVEELLNEKYRKDLGEMDAETITKKLAFDIAMRLSMHLAQVKVELMETSKYGVSIE